LATRYFSSLYWAVATMTAVGYGDITATNLGERVFSIVTQLIGACIFGFIIGNISHLLDTVDARGSAYRNKMDELKAYMHDRNLPKTFRHRVRDYFDYYLSRKSLFDESLILTELSPHLRSEVVMESHMELITGITFFEGQDPGLITFIVTRLRPFFLPAAGILFRRGDVALEM
jgi:hypothetical protein